MRRIIMSNGLAGLTYFPPPHLMNDTISGTNILNIKCVFLFSLQLLSETFLILRRTLRDVVTNAHRSAGTVPDILVRV